MTIQIDIPVGKLSKLRKIADEVVFSVKENEVEIYAMSPSGSSLVYLKAGVNLGEKTGDYAVSTSDLSDLSSALRADVDIEDSVFIVDYVNKKGVRVKVSINTAQPSVKTGDLAGLLAKNYSSSIHVNVDVLQSALDEVGSDAVLLKIDSQLKDLVLSSSEPVKRKEARIPVFNLEGEFKDVKLDGVAFTEIVSIVKDLSKMAYIRQSDDGLVMVESENGLVKAFMAPLLD
ncbi:MAG: hypothetical protein QW320_06575 [Ignisphaera sp.]|uniref:hypothetical protein n=1 Tax=Thermofilum sp. TaxID=1961369 RepID=UPI00315EB2C5